MKNRPYPQDTTLCPTMRKNDGMKLAHHFWKYLDEVRNKPDSKYCR